ncbi:hypothetical protein H0H87_007734 [Tephrocybe sp. NHM501043]|nr:hypothetical protein H0H87_007734 [Tephrocybe sp. NHM501043]
MTTVSWSFGWAAISRALSHSAFRSGGASLTLRSSSQFTTKALDLDFVGNTTKPSSQPIFEDSSDEYASVAHAIQPPTPPIASIIESKLPLRLPQPSPSDIFIFEDASCEDYETSAVSVGNQPFSVFQVITKLVAENRYREAYSFCLEMQSANIEIPKSDIFGRVARAAIAGRKAKKMLIDNPTSEQEIINQFTLWISLLPSIHNQNQPHGHKGLRREVYQTLRPNITIPMRYALMMAEKGYAKLISSDVIPYMLRFASPLVSIRFIEKFLKADLAYFTEADPELNWSNGPPPDAQEVIQRKQELAEYIQGPAIEMFARLTDFSSAMTLLPNPSNPYQLSAHTYDFLLSRMGFSDDHSHHIGRVKKLRDDPRYSTLPSVTTAIQKKYVMSSRTLQNYEMLEKESEPASRDYIGDELATQLRLIIHQIQTSTLSQSLVTTFLTDYHDARRTNAIIPLRKIALRRNRVVALTFLCAEMDYYLKLGQYLLVLKTFKNNFYLTGFVEKDFIAILHYLESDAEIDRSHPAYQTIGSPVRRKLWASRAHTDFAWHALAQSTPLGPRFEELYNNFIELHSRQYGHDETHLGTHPRAAFHVGGSVFNVLLKRLLKSLTEADHAAIALNDMIKIGFHPTIHHYTLLATFYANHDDIPRAFQVINALEAAHPVDIQRSMLRDLMKSMKQSFPGIPTPDVVHYTSLLAAFAHRQHLDEALEVQKLCDARFDYYPGIHLPLDEARMTLKALQKQKELKSTASLE